jgi:ribose transport system permease protein
MPHTIEGLKRNTFNAKEFFRRFNVGITFVAMVLFASIATSGRFFDISNILNVAERASIVGIVAIGQTLVILIGAIDLSVNSIMAISFSSIVLLTTQGVPYSVAILLAIIFGVLYGTVNGLLVSMTNIPPFLVTLGTMIIGKSLAQTLAGSTMLNYKGLQEFLNNLFSLNETSSRLFPSIVWIILSIIFIIVLSKTRFGLNTYAVGGGPRAAFLSGVKGNNIKVIVFVISGMMAAAAGVMMAYRLGTLNTLSSERYQIESIAAVVLGGTNVNGGEGSVYGSFFGAIAIAMLTNVLNLLRVDPYIQYAIMGFLLIIIVFNVSFFSNRRKGN